MKTITLKEVKKIIYTIPQRNITFTGVYPKPIYIIDNEEYLLVEEEA